MQERNAAFLRQENDINQAHLSKTSVKNGGGKRNFTFQQQ
jgi:hypothetical protein